MFLGIDILEENKFSVLKGKRIGILTHAAGVNRKGISTIEVLCASKHFTVTKLFGPEHSIYGDAKANQKINNQIDPKTNLPVYSLYGRYRKPKPEMLDGIDTLVIDLQDIGVRSYTYISCMLYAMEACFENDIEVIVLDRPNPLGGRKVDGPMIDSEWKSYVGAFPVPYLHGLTIGELAICAKYIPGWMGISNELQKKGRLKVVPMRGWKRTMLWPDTKLTWVPTSPNIPSFAAVLGYAMTGLGAQEGGFSHGIGTPYPFRFLTHKKLSADKLLNKLKELNIQGLDFKIIRTRNTKGTPLKGVYVGINSWGKLKPTEISFKMMLIAIDLESTNPFKASEHPDLFNKHVGSSKWWLELTQDKRIPRINYFMRLWSKENQSYIKTVKNFLIYN